MNRAEHRIYLEEVRIRNYRKLQRRKRELRRKMIMGFAALLMLTVLAVGFGGIVSFAKTESEMKASYKYFTTVTVRSGDSLWSIADHYMDEEHYLTHEKYINELKQSNHLYEDTIRPGQLLIVPYYSTEYFE